MRSLVTGAGGFLGGALARRLLARGDQVRGFARGEYQHLRQLGVEMIRGDLADEHAVRSVTEGCDIVFHVAAKAGVWGSYGDYYRSNVEGTNHVVAACRANGVKRLVYTSTPSVVFQGGDMEGVDESVPYASHYLTHYPRTKAIAERSVLAANDGQLATAALRPHLIWGPGDNHLVPRIIARAKAGRLRQIGQRQCLVDSSYIDNVVDAHLLAGDRLSSGSAVAGKAYFISQGEPLPIWELINRILAAAGLPPVTRHVSPTLAYLAGGLLEIAYCLLRCQTEPPMTRFVARQLSTAHWFDISAARRDFGYEPAVSTEEGLRRLADWLGNRTEIG